MLDDALNAHEWGNGELKMVSWIYLSLRTLLPLSKSLKIRVLVEKDDVLEYLYDSHETVPF